MVFFLFKNFSSNLQLKAIMIIFKDLSNFIFKKINSIFVKNKMWVITHQFREYKITHQL